jgi:FtsP/CotA-like multicopper oxidase with cupredoxin domain
MMTRREREARHQEELLKQATAARLTRRDALKMGVITGSAGILKTGGALAQTNDVTDLAPSPRVTRPWLEPMPVPRIMQAVNPATHTHMGSNSYAYKPHDPTFHQYWSRFPAQKYYYSSVSAAPHVFHPDLGAPSTIWGFDASFPGTTLDMRYGQPVVLRINNGLPPLSTHTGFGIPQTINHLHNFHTAPESDGGPWDWADPANPNQPGECNDNHYTMARAGFSLMDNAADSAKFSAIPAEFRTWHGNGRFGGDARETLTTLFTHQHRPEFTAANVYKGQAKMARVFDEKDTGDETQGFRMPNAGYRSSNNYSTYDRATDYDIPIVIADKHFDSTGQLLFDQFNDDGFLGDHITVNGKIKPYFVVKRRRYRFRVLNIGPARFVRIVLRYQGKSQPFHQIGDNGNLLEKSVTVTQVEQWAAERNDYVVDFSRFPAGARVYLANNMAMSDGRRADRDSVINPDLPANQLIEFQVANLPAGESDGSWDFFAKGQQTFRPFPDLAQLAREVVRTRTFKFERTNGMWAINGRLWDPEEDHSPSGLANPLVQIERNSAEKWILESSSGGWHHPVHIHFEEGRVLNIDGKVPALKTRQDVYRVGRDFNRTELLMRFRDFPEPGYYRKPPKQRRPYGNSPLLARHPNEHARWVMHCHNLTHEDHAMMATWNIIPRSTDV